jgi:acylphosphatase
MGTKEGGTPVRCRVVYAGRVQGVFFRATTLDLSCSHAVVGYVRNCPDGTVELEAEGLPDDVDAFLLSVAGHFEGHITRASRTTLAARGDESRFEIRY